MSCLDCVSVSRLASQLNVRASFIWQLVSAGKVDVHRHGGRTTVTKSSAGDLQWHVAVARERWENAA